MAARKRAARKAPSRKTVAREPEEPEDEDDEEEEEAEEASSKPVLMSFNPETHVCVPVETFASMVNAKNEHDARARAQAEAEAKRVESMMLGFQTGSTVQAQQIEEAYKRIAQEREHADRWRREATEKDYELSRKIRESEDVRLERDRLAADMERARIANQRLEMELEAKVRQRVAELEAVRKASAPIFSAVSQGLQMLMQQHVVGKLGGAAGLPGGSAANAGAGGAGGAPGASKSSGATRVRMSIDNTESFRTAFRDVLDVLSPEAVGCLRAIVCSNVLPNAPAMPEEVLRSVLALVVRDAGEERVQNLLFAAAQAYVEEVPAQAEASAPN